MKLQTSVEPKRYPCASGTLSVVRQKKISLVSLSLLLRRGEFLYELAKTAINKLDLRLENIIAECFDGAANVSGIRKGLATRMKECSPLGIYVHCYGHLLNLALQDTMTEIETLRNAVGTIQSLYNFLHGSTKHHALFKDIEVHEDEQVPRIMEALVTLSKVPRPTTKVIRFSTQFVT